MTSLSFDWLPWRFWVSAVGSTVMLVLALLAVGAIDDGAASDAAGAGAALRHTQAKPGHASAPGYVR